MERKELAQYIFEKHKEGQSFATIRNNLINNKYPTQIVDEIIQDIRSKQLINFITVKHKAGYPKESIKNILLNQGYHSEEINKAFWQCGINTSPLRNINQNFNRTIPAKPNFTTTPPVSKSQTNEKNENPKSYSFFSDIKSKINNLINNLKNLNTKKSPQTNGINPYYLVTGAFVLFWIILIVFLIGYFDSEDLSGHERTREPTSIDVSITDFESSIEDINYRMTTDNGQAYDFEVRIQYTVKTGEKIVFEKREIINFNEISNKNFYVRFDEKLSPGTYKLKKSILGGGNEIEIVENFEIQETLDKEYQLYINISGEGSVNLEEGNHTYTKNEEININASPEEGWKFDKFKGDCSGQECNITMDENKEVTAIFIQKDDDEKENGEKKYQLSIKIEGEGNTTPGEGNHSFSKGEVVKINTTSVEGWKFNEFSGDCSGTKCEITMDDNKEVIATFSQEKDSEYKYNLTIKVLGKGNTTPKAGNHSFQKGKKIEINVTPYEDRIFDGFLGDCSGTSCEITMDDNKEVIATFSKDSDQKHQLTINKQGQGNTTPKVGDHFYPEGVNLTIVAFGKEGWEFDEFTGDCSGTNCEITMDDDKEVTAVFVENEYNLLIEMEDVTSAEDVAEAFREMDEVDFFSIDDIKLSISFFQIPFEVEDIEDSIIFMNDYRILESEVGGALSNTAIELNQISEVEELYEKEIVLMNGETYEFVQKNSYMLSHSDFFPINSSPETVAEAFHNLYENHLENYDGEITGNVITLNNWTFVEENTSEIIGTIEDDGKKIEFNSSNESWKGEELQLMKEVEEGNTIKITQGMELANYHISLNNEKISVFNTQDSDSITFALAFSLGSLIEFKNNIFLHLLEDFFDIENTSDELIKDHWSSRLEFDEPTDWQNEQNELILEKNGQEIVIIFEYDASEELLKILKEN